MPKATFGNVSLISKVEHPDPSQRNLVTVHYDHVTQTESYIDLPGEWRPETDPANLAEWSNDESFRSITYPGGWWSMHSAAAPAWVEVPEWPALEAVLRQWYGCDGRPADWENKGIDDEPNLRVEVPGAPAADVTPETLPDTMEVEVAE